MSSSSVVLRCKGILFDMDGILISSITSVDRSWTKWSLMRDVDPAYAISIVHGKRAIESVRRLRPDLDADTELKILEEFEIADKEDLKVLPGVTKLLASLPNGRWTVVTSATGRLAKVRLTDAGLPVPERFIHGDSVTEGKPNPAPFLAGAALLGFAPQDCIVFEDSAAGVLAGHRAGCTVVATLFSHEAEHLESADYLVNDLTGIQVAQTENGLELTFEPLARS